MVYEVSQGRTRPLRFVLTSRGGVTLPITGATVTLTIVRNEENWLGREYPAGRAGGAGLVLGQDLSCEVVDAAGGVVTWTPGTVLECGAGEYLVQFRIVFGDGYEDNGPAPGDLVLAVTPALRQP